ncbi:MAG: serine hydrolase [Erythrobacter sp.]|uniref:serine hydrolase domain-containing protein n=1 Tax=Erythrobacter sp. TaxID=1042 RepID=UPI00260C809A|nr:serine hydrolase [Erythrobacter sp.]MDJ0977886.1 serine hydrolase [Erythrobacter sp.]
MKKWLLAGSVALGVSGCTATMQTANGVDAALPELEEVRLLPPPEVDPADLQVLFWNDEQRSQRFREMEKWFAGHEVPAATTPSKLVRGDPLPEAIASEIRATMAKTNAAGVMVWHKGAVRFEDYALDFGPEQRWTSFSVAKSFTSTLLGAAIADGFIGDLSDPVTQYIPELEGSAYDGVTVRQLATMTSGVAWNEDYTDPDSDVAQMNRYVLEYGANAIVEQMKRLERDTEPGAKFVYKTGETNLIGLLVENAVGLPLAEYAQEKIVEPAGFEGGLFWMVDPRGGNIGGCCLSLSLADYTRMGVFVLNEGRSPDGTSSVPDGWFGEAGDSVVDFGDSGFGYGYQWWTYPGGNFGAQGIFGQSITLVPSQDLVLTVVSNWPKATSDEYRSAWSAVAAKIAASGT